MDDGAEPGLAGKEATCSVGAKVVRNGGGIHANNCTKPGKSIHLEMAGGAGSRQHCSCKELHKHNSPAVADGAAPLTSNNNNNNNACPTNNEH